MRLGRAIVFSLAGRVAASFAMVAPASASPAFEQRPCDLPGTTPQATARYRCGTVSVPRDRSEPGAGAFRLAVVIVKSEARSRQADPVAYVTAGPDVPPTNRATAIAAREARSIAPDRDLILVDPRGSGHSEPALCPDLAREQVAALASGLDRQALLVAWRDAYATCRLEMADDGVKPEWFGSQASAEDLEAVRQALGIGRWNLYAPSHGTTTALNLMALHPESVRAVVLDSIPGPDPRPDPQRKRDGALDRFFAACRGDAACALGHPDLAARYAEALRTLDVEPVAVPMPPGLGVQVFDLRGTTFGIIVDRLLSSRPGATILPAFIAAAAGRDAAALEPILAGVARGVEAMSLGDMAAVGCRDEPGWRGPQADGDLQVGRYVPGMCKDWSPLGPPMIVPQGSTIPSLVVAGSLDPSTPPDAARFLAKALGASATLIDGAGDAHGPLGASCMSGLLAAFVRDPSGAVDRSCVDARAPPSFR